MLNLDHVHSVIPGGDEGIRELAKICADECRQKLRELEQAIAAADAILINRLAHTIKSSAGYFDATSVREAALRLELVGRDERLGEAPAAFNHLKPADR